MCNIFYFSKDFVTNIEADEYDILSFFRSFHCVLSSNMCELRDFGEIL